MYTIILFLVLGVIAIYPLLKGSYVADICLLLFCGAFAGACAGLLIGVGVSALVPYKEFQSDPVNLVAVRSSDGLNGAFVWGSGSLSSQTYFHFYVRNADDSMTPGAVEANARVRITEDLYLKGQGTLVSRVRQKDLTSSWTNWAVILDNSPRIVSHDFRVPVGTVVRSFNLR